MRSFVHVEAREIYDEIGTGFLVSPLHGPLIQSFI